MYKFHLFASFVCVSPNDKVVTRELMYSRNVAFSFYNMFHYGALLIIERHCKWRYYAFGQ